MDFFEQQAAARKQTGWLILFFVLGVLLTAAALYFLILLIASILEAPVGKWGVDDHLILLGCVAGFELIVVGGGSFYKVSSLNRTGGDGVAELMGGRLLVPGSRDPVERRALNVVEEMAIASGVPVPRVYVLDTEASINAFAAGHSPSDAVIGLTRGTLTKLTREELSGTVAHEFSHILNGDMRLNLRLMGVLFGILVIGLIGLESLRSLRIVGRGSGRGTLAIVAFAVGFLAIGYIGYFFGSLIKAAVSRQREFLADASAVQFTRNPEGIAGALMQIGAVPKGSAIRHPAAPELSHMFFGKGVSGISQMLSTHPALDDRIRRILPRWDGTYPAPRYPKRGDRAAPTPATGGKRQAGPLETPLAASLLDAAGRPTTRHVTRAAELLHTIPEPVLDAAREPYGARAVVFLLLLSPKQDVREAQLAALKDAADPGVRKETERLLCYAADIGRGARLPLIDLTISSLRTLIPDQADRFLRCVDALVQADNRLDLFEWMLMKVITRHLGRAWKNRAGPLPRAEPLSAVRTSIAQLFTSLARLGRPDGKGSRSAFDAGARAVGMPDLEPVAGESGTLAALDFALDRAARVGTAERRKLLAAAEAVISADRVITVTEAEVFRAVADTLGVPVPPVLPGKV